MEKDFKELISRYTAAAHAVQSGIALEMKRDPSTADPKHLRTGIDLSKAEQGGLAELLIAKGVFTQAEYIEAMTLAAEKEKKRYETWLSEKLGIKVELL